MTPVFTAHNVLLPDGTRTIPAQKWLVAESPWYLSAERTLSLVYGRHIQEKSIVDLGCMEGGYSVEFARRGLAVTGIEVRRSNLIACEFLKSKLGLPRLRFVQDDVWNVAEHGEFDIAFCCGLLYHLDRPREFIRRISSLTRGVVIINTHFATREPTSKHNLSELTEHEGLPGRWYSEHQIDDPEELDKFRLTSWSNKASFWPLREAIPYILNDAGFDLVLEQYDWLGARFDGFLGRSYSATDQRGMFVGIRTGALVDSMRV